ncbi:hypothetical protein FB451DRAFT_985804, partial [Mycena latifolia]
NGMVPSVVTNNMKLPQHALIQGIDGVAEDQRVKEAEAAAAKDIATAHATATNYMLTLYTVQVEKCRAQLDVTACANAMAASLTEYAHGIITSSGDDDITVWTPCIAFLQTAFVKETKNLKFEFTAVLQKEAESKETKANAVHTARADAVMEDATRPI